MSVYTTILPWLTKTQKAKVRDLIENTIVKELRCRNWGDWANGTAQGGHHRLIVYDYKGLLLASGVLRYILGQYNTDLYYRGQRIDWPLLPSIFRTAKTKLDRTANIAWLGKALRHVKRAQFDFKGSSAEREALCQHYGLQTRWLDIIDNIHSALWFASYETKEVAKEISATPKRNHNLGYIYLMAAPKSKNNKYSVIKDLREKPSQWLRPHIQQAFVVRLKDEMAFSSKFDHLAIMTICVPIEMARKWSNIETITEQDMFPNESFDDGLRFWNRAKDALNTAGLAKPPK
jgi:hypothetical protein